MKKKKEKFGTDKRGKKYKRGGLRQKIGKIVCLGRNNQEYNQRRIGISMGSMASMRSMGKRDV